SGWPPRAIAPRPDYSVFYWTALGPVPTIGNWKRMRGLVVRSPILRRAPDRGRTAVLRGCDFLHTICGARPFHITIVAYETINSLDIPLVFFPAGGGTGSWRLGRQGGEAGSGTASGCSFGARRGWRRGVCRRR